MIDTRFIARLICLLIPLGMVSTAANAAESPTTANTTDAGDYYLGLDGHPIRFRRKNQQFLKLDSIRAARKHSRQAKLSPSASAALRPAPHGFSRVKKHRWGKLELIDSTAPKASAAAKRNFRAANQQSQLAPIFTNESGKGEYLILPDILISFNSAADVQLNKQAMLDQFDLVVKNQLMFSETNFLLAFESPVQDYAAVFKTTRDLMDLPYIAWAEPNMLVKLKKTATPDPNDYLFREQWGLYNWGLKGEYCDAAFLPNGIAADIDANDAWDFMGTLSLPDYPRFDSNGDIIYLAGKGPLIAIIDDGVKLNHADLSIWSNPSPGTGIPMSANRCENDTNGCNFGDFYESGGRVYNNSSSVVVVPPDPQTVNDTHGTKVAGIAAATRNNTIDISGSAYNAEILPVRLDFYSGAMDCTSIVDALSYAAKYADVIVNGWGLDGGDTPSCQSTINSKLTEISSANVLYKRGANGGTPVLFASGNSAAGWQKISVPLASGFNAIKLVFHKDDRFLTDEGEDAVWIDDLTIPANDTLGSTFFDFESGLPAGIVIADAANSTVTQSGIVTDYNQCAAVAANSDTTVTGADEHVYGGSGSSVKLSIAAGNCEYLNIPVNLTEFGNMTFWVWMSAEPWEYVTQPNDVDQLEGDPFRVYVNGAKIANVDLISAENNPIDPSQNSLIENVIYHNQLDYPASHSNVIAVGASNNGSDAQMEDREYFSQYGSDLNIVAPGRSIRTTTSSGSYGYLSGTSAATPMVAGVIANMLAVDPTLTLAEIKTYLQDGADQIGPEADQAYDASNEFSYDGSGFNSYYGHGRTNSYKSTYLAADAAGHSVVGFPVPPLSQAETCEDPNPDAADDGWLLLVMPAILAAALKNKTP